ncbi:hypothetical protein PO909_022553 [Leuciscus waleckii]
MQSLFRSSPVVSSLFYNSLFGSVCSCMGQFTREHSVHPSRQCQVLPGWSGLFAPARFTHYSHPCVLDGTQHLQCRSWSELHSVPHGGGSVCRLAGLVFAMHGWAVALLFWPPRQGRRRNHHR